MRSFSETFFRTAREPHRPKRPHAYRSPQEYVRFPDPGIVYKLPRRYHPGLRTEFPQRCLWFPPDTTTPRSEASGNGVLRSYKTSLPRVLKASHSDPRGVQFPVPDSMSRRPTPLRYEVLQSQKKARKDTHNPRIPAEPPRKMQPPERMTGIPLRRSRSPLLQTIRNAPL